MSLEEEMILAMVNVTKHFLSLVHFRGFQSKAIDEGPTGKLLSTHSHNYYSSNSDYVRSKIGLVGIESHCKEIVNTSALIPVMNPSVPNPLGFVKVVSPMEDTKLVVISPEAGLYAGPSYEAKKPSPYSKAQGPLPREISFSLLHSGKPLEEGC